MKVGSKISVTKACMLDILEYLSILQDKEKSVCTYAHLLANFTSEISISISHELLCVSRLNLNAAEKSIDHR